MSRNFVSQRTVNAIIGGIFSKARENKINKENEEKLSNIENLFNSVISCENKQDIETILGTGNVEKILKDSYIVFYNKDNVVQRSYSSPMDNIYGHRVYSRNKQIGIKVKFSKDSDEVLEITKVGF